MANEALDLAIGSINFNPYDNDGNGYVSSYVGVPTYYTNNFQG
jgi:immune inhibitor A